MKTLVVYESLFGNTEVVARAVAEGLASHGEVEVREVNAADAWTSAPDLLVVGGPTHAFSMTPPATRRDADANGADPVHATTGLREWIDRLPKGSRLGLAACFDTRVEKVKNLPGSAARKADWTVHRRGYQRAAEPESFYVLDIKGPLVAGERERARQWGNRLGSAVSELLARSN
jgi:flavodoxin